MSFLSFAVNARSASMAVDSLETMTLVDRATNERKTTFREGIRKIFCDEGIIVGTVGQISRIRYDGSRELIEKPIEELIASGMRDPDEIAFAVARWFAETPTFVVEENSSLLLLIAVARPNFGWSFPFQAYLYEINRDGVARPETIGKTDCMYAGDYTLREPVVKNAFERFGKNTDPDEAEAICRSAVESVIELGDRLVAEKRLAYNTVGGDVRSAVMLPDGSIRKTGF